MNYAVIMAGGAGTRLWPAARRSSPKQLQRFIFEKPLIAETVHRLSRHGHVASPSVLQAAASALARVATDGLPCHFPVSRTFRRPSCLVSSRCVPTASLVVPLILSSVLEFILSFRISPAGRPYPLVGWSQFVLVRRARTEERN